MVRLTRQLQTIIVAERELQSIQIAEELCRPRHGEAGIEPAHRQGHRAAGVAPTQNERRVSGERKRQNLRVGERRLKRQLFLLGLEDTENVEVNVDDRIVRLGKARRDLTE